MENSHDMKVTDAWQFCCAFKNKQTNLLKGIFCWVRIRITKAKRKHMAALNFKLCRNEKNIWDILQICGTVCRIRWPVILNNGSWMPVNYGSDRIQILIGHFRGHWKKYVYQLISKYYKGSNFFFLWILNKL
jgi:hypothetical protein